MTPTHTHTPLSLTSRAFLLSLQAQWSLGEVQESQSPELFESSVMGSSLVLSYNSRLFIIELDYGYRYLLKVCSELSDICFLIWLRYCSMLALHDRPVLAMVNISCLELYQLLQYSYVCSSVMSVHPEGGGLRAGHQSIPYQCRHGVWIS